MSDSIVADARRWRFEPPEPLLDLATRKGLHRVGYIDVHHTSMSYWRECHAVLGFELGRSPRSKDVRLLLGGVLHKAFDDEPGCRDHGQDSDWWQELFYICKAEQEERDGAEASFGYKGGTLKKSDVLQLSLDFCNPSILGGVTLRGLVVGTLDRIRSYGYEVAATELRMIHNVGGSIYPVTFTGTIDLKLISPRAGLIGLVDVKSYGIWSAYLDCKSASASRHSADEITYLPQNRHYHWLHSLKYPKEEINFYGLVLPTNLVPYKKSGSGYKAGDIKDTPLFIGPALNMSFVRDYEHQMKSWLRLISQGHFEKLMPMGFGGKVKCPECPYFSSCMSDPTASRGADLFSGTEYDYVRED